MTKWRIRSTLCQQNTRSTSCLSMSSQVVIISVIHIELNSNVNMFRFMCSPLSRCQPSLESDYSPLTLWMMSTRQWSGQQPYSKSHLIRREKGNRCQCVITLLNTLRVPRLGSTLAGVGSYPPEWKSCWLKRDKKWTKAHKNRWASWWIIDGRMYSSMRPVLWLVFRIIPGVNKGLRRSGWVG